MTSSRAHCIASIYLSGFLQGCAFVLIPALGNTFTAKPYLFSASHYALLFLPQTAGAISGAVAAGRIQRYLGIRRLFRLGLLSNLLAMLLLLAVAHTGGPSAYALMLAEGLLLGLGFGWTVASINQYSADLFGGAGASAITLLNALIGAATAASPLILDFALTRGNWSIWPLLLAGGFCLVSLAQWPEEPDRQQPAFWPPGLLPFVLITLIYAICEGSFASWASVYVSASRGHGDGAGALALSAFWGSMTIFRVVLALLPAHRVSQRALLFASAVGISFCFAGLPWLSGLSALIGAFALAGAACSIYYPFVMSLSLARFPQSRTQVAGLVVAALMVGEGVGSYGLGLLQQYLPLQQIYLTSALWGFALLAGARLIAHPRES